MEIESVESEISEVSENSLGETLIVSSSPSMSYSSTLNLTVFSPSGRMNVYSPTPSIHSPVASVHLSGEDICVICFSDVLDDRLVLNCTHVFHGECIAGWFLNGTRTGRRKCPICKERMTADRITQSSLPSPVNTDIALIVEDEDSTDLDTLGFCENICQYHWRGIQFGVSRRNCPYFSNVIQFCTVIVACYIYVYVYLMFVIVHEGGSYWANIHFFASSTVMFGVGRIICYVSSGETERRERQQMIQQRRVRRRSRIYPTIQNE